MNVRVISTSPDGRRRQVCVVYQENFWYGPQDRRRKIRRQVSVTRHLHWDATRKAWFGRPVPGLHMAHSHDVTVALSGHGARLPEKGQVILGRGGKPVAFKIPVANYSGWMEAVQKAA